MVLLVILGVLAALGLVSAAVLLGVVIAQAKKKVDRDEDECEQMAGIFDQRLHWPEMGDVFRKLGRFNLIGAIKKLKIAWALYAGDKIWVLITKHITKGIPAVLHNTDHDAGIAQRMEVAKVIATELPGLMQSDDTGVLFDDAIFTEATGLALDPAAKSQLVLVAAALGEWGMDDTAAIIRDFTDDKPQLSKALIAAVAADLSTEAGRTMRAKKVLVKLVPHMMLDKDSGAWLRALVAAQPVTA